MYTFRELTIFHIRSKAALTLSDGLNIRTFLSDRRWMSDDGTEVILIVYFIYSIFSKHLMNGLV